MANEKIERRFVPAAGLRVEKRDDGGMPKLGGYAAVFNQRSVELWGFYELIAPGAFADSLAAGDDVRALWNHDPNWILARSTNKTLRMVEDDHGLAVDFDPIDTPTVRGFVASIERGDVSQMSFAFVATDDEWDIDANEQWVRRVKRARLFDVSPVTYPAYQGTEIGLRSAGSIDPNYGYIPALPAALQQALQDDGQAQRLLRAQALRARQIRLASMG